LLYSLWYIKLLGATTGRTYNEPEKESKRTTTEPAVETPTYRVKPPISVASAGVEVVVPGRIVVAVSVDVAAGTFHFAGSCLIYLICFHLGHNIHIRLIYSRI
jgi:hypothetical protein